MTKNQQDASWSSLSKEVKDEMIRDYNERVDTFTSDYTKGYEEALAYYFGHHNLTSYTKQK